MAMRTLVSRSGEASAKSAKLVSISEERNHGKHPDGAFGLDENKL